VNNDKVCLPCRIGLHDECELAWDDALEPDQDCCCGGRYTLRDHWKQIIAEDQDIDSDGYPAPSAQAPGERKRGDSGYIAAAAWPGNADIGTLADPESTGRKRVKKMYPIEVGTPCEWSGLAAAGGGVHPILGCLNNPATDWHHGPDKNTLDNEKCSRGVGESENVHIICSWCHNAWHAANDPTYPDYDRNVQQAQPWLPDGEWSVHDPDTRAATADLIEQERIRREDDDGHGLQRRGRTPRSGSITDTSISDDVG